MKTTTETPLSELYEQDETAWLDRMACLAAEGRRSEFDLENLSEFLTSMADRDRRAVYSRLFILLTHRLKWKHQPERRTNSWAGTIREQRRKLDRLLTSAVLRTYALGELSTAYDDARRQAALETGKPRETFPATCPWTLDELLAEEERGDDDADRNHFE